MRRMIEDIDDEAENGRKRRKKRRRGESQSREEGGAPRRGANYRGKLEGKTREYFSRMKNGTHRSGKDG